MYLIYVNVKLLMVLMYRSPMMSHTETCVLHMAGFSLAFGMFSCLILDQYFCVSRPVITGLIRLQSLLAIRLHSPTAYDTIM